MGRIIKTMEDKYRIPALDLVERVFTEHSDAEEGNLVRRLVEEIRAKRFYLPELELVMVYPEGKTFETRGLCKKTGRFILDNV